MDIQENISLAPFTTFGIGGPAKYFCKAESIEDIVEAVRFAQEKNVPYLIIGGGSNLLISDEGFPGLVIKNEISSINLEDNIIKVKSGTPLTNLIGFTAQHGLSGLQKLTGIYGTVGGAVFGNAGAYGQTISDYLIEVECLQNGKIITLSKAQCQFDYRDSAFKRNLPASRQGYRIILEIHFQLPKGDTPTLQKEVQELIIQRQTKFSPNLKCPGSFFKNIPVEKIPPKSLKLIPKDKITHDKVPAAVLLELAGAKGQRSGDIQVSENHANLIINEGKGTAKDVWKLTHDLSLAVKEKFGISLEPEVQFINLPPLN